MVLLVNACDPDDRPIVPGVYEGELGGEKIVVTPTSLELHIKVRVVKSLNGRYVIGIYKYRVDESNRIKLSISSNDFAIIEYNNYQWYWTKQNIIRVNEESGEETWFIKINDIEN